MSVLVKKTSSHYFDNEKSFNNFWNIEFKYEICISNINMNISLFSYSATIGGRRQCQ